MLRSGRFLFMAWSRFCILLCAFRLRGMQGCLSGGRKSRSSVSGFFVCGCWGRYACVCAGIRVLLSCFTRCPCAGRHLLFFAAAKKSRQKKAAHTANPCCCLRAPTGSYTSHGNFPVRVRCQRSCRAPHPLRAPASQRAMPDSPRPPRWQTVCRPKCSTRLTSDR